MLPVSTTVDNLHSPVQTQRGGEPMEEQPRADNPRVTVTLAPHVLDKLDRLAASYGLNRSGAVSLLIVQATEPAETTTVI